MIVQTVLPYSSAVFTTHITEASFTEFLDSAMCAVPAQRVKCGVLDFRLTYPARLNKGMWILDCCSSEVGHSDVQHLDQVECCCSS